MDLVIWDKDRKSKKVDLKIKPSESFKESDSPNQTWIKENRNEKHFRRLFAKLKINVFVNQDFDLTFDLLLDEMKTPKQCEFSKYLPNFEWSVQNDPVDVKDKPKFPSKRNDESFLKEKDALEIWDECSKKTCRLKRLKKIKRPEQEGTSKKQLVHGLRQNQLFGLENEAIRNLPNQNERQNEFLRESHENHFLQMQTTKVFKGKKLVLKEQRKYAILTNRIRFYT